MKAAIFHGPHKPLTIEDVEIDKPMANEALVRVVASGVCHSDLHALKGEWEMGLPLILGHEGSGVVEAIGEGVKRVAVGDRVVLNWTAGCGSCFYCLIGQPHLCEHLLETTHQNVMFDGTTRLRRDGEPIYSFLGVASFGEYAVVPESGAVAIGDGIALDLASVVGCAVATGFGAASKTVRVPVGASVAIVGVGGIGLAILQGCVAQSAGSVIAIDVHDDKLTLAKDLGATHLINARADDPIAGVHDLTGGRGVDFAFEAIGLKATIEQVLAMLGRRGTAVLVGMPPEGTLFEADPLTMTAFEQRIVGSNYGSANAAVDFPRLAELAERGHIDLASMVTRRIKLDQINDAFAAMERGEGIRTVITYD